MSPTRRGQINTVVLRAWKEALGAKNCKAQGDQFEELEHKMIGHDGLEGARNKIAKIEVAFALNDIAPVTAPAPPQNA